MEDQRSTLSPTTPLTPSFFLPRTPITSRPNPLTSPVQTSPPLAPMSPQISAESQLHPPYLTLRPTAPYKVTKNVSQIKFSDPRSHSRSRSRSLKSQTLSSRLPSCSTLPLRTKVPTNLTYTSRRQSKKSISSVTPAFRNALSHMSTPLRALFSVSTGRPHPKFPHSILQYHLLTHDVLDELTVYYHQTTLPSTDLYGRDLREEYPAPMGRKAWVVGSAPVDRLITTSGADKAKEAKLVVKTGISLATKRRRFGRFIGLRGCDSPVDVEQPQQQDEIELDTEDEEEQEKMNQQLEKEFERKMRIRREEDEAREKMGGRRDWY